jgi:thiosulfate dehydrogenase [quinone] large subunit
MKKEILHLNYSGWQIFALTTMRVLIGWHFLYEGLVKVYTPWWTAKAYLLGSVGPLSPLFRSIAGSETILHIVNTLNEWGLVIIGLGLFVGLFSKICKISGMILLILYYMAYPPFAGLSIDAHVEGSYWIVNKNLIEMGALFILYVFPSSRITGLDRFLKIYSEMSGEKNHINKRS